MRWAGRRRAAGKQAVASGKSGMPRQARGACARPICPMQPPRPACLLPMAGHSPPSRCHRSSSARRLAAFGTRAGAGTSAAECRHVRGANSTSKEACTRGAAHPAPLCSQPRAGCSRPPAAGTPPAGLRPSGTPAPSCAPPCMGRTRGVAVRLAGGAAGGASERPRHGAARRSARGAPERQAPTLQRVQQGHDGAQVGSDDVDQDLVGLAREHVGCGGGGEEGRRWRRAANGQPQQRSWTQPC